MSKRKTDKDSELTDCQYGENCYRKNPQHFKEYAHPHLEKLLHTCYMPATDTFNVPDDFFMSREVILEQLVILRSIKREKPTAEEPTDQLSTANNVSADPQVQKKGKTTDSVSHNVDKQLPTTSKKVELPTGRNPPASDDQKGPAKPGPDKKITDFVPVVLPRGQMAQKLEAAAPYNFFLTAITDSQRTHSEPLSVTFQELFDTSLGIIEATCQINFMVEIGWLLGHYHFAGIDQKPLLVLHGDDFDEYKARAAKRSNITFHKVDVGGFGVHHTKMMLIAYTDGGMRVIVSTANLYEADWDNRTQGVWISPRCEPLSDTADTSAGESATGFKRDLLDYLVLYKIPILQEWISKVRKSNFSKVNVFLVASSRGGHRDGPRGPSFGHPRLGYLLSKHCAPIPDTCHINFQSSSIGNLGPTPEAWVLGEVTNSFRRDSGPATLSRLPPFRMIYPTIGNVLNSHNGIVGGGCLPYQKATHLKQPWLQNYLHQWKANKRFRSQAMPHIKTYCRYANDELYWFLLTSANLSKVAWGVYNKSSKIDPPLRIMSYEAGVLFLPKFVIGNNAKIFPLRHSSPTVPIFPMPYDLPATKYGADDVPFFYDDLQ